MNDIKKIRILTAFYIAALILAGITAFPIETETNWLCDIFAIEDCENDINNDISSWIKTVNNGITFTNKQYPFIAYGFDWLAFAHIVIAILFIGAFINPIRNKWIYEWGLICCALIIPLAFICGPIRAIPIYWRLIDCSFGVLGCIPLIYCLRLINKIEKTT